MPIADKPNPLIYSPRTLNECLSLLNSHPRAAIFAGGTSRFSDQPEDGFMDGSILVSIHQVDDLRKVSHWERSLDLGAGLNLNQVSLASRNLLSPLVRKAVAGIGNSSLRNLATLGGNLCQKNHFGDLFPVFYSLGAAFEFRSLRSSRWVSGPEAHDAPDLAPRRGEVLTRVRLPIEDWQLGFYERVGHFRTPWDERISLVCLAKIADGVVTSIRLCFFLPQIGVLRDRKLEAELSGQRLPLGPKERETVLEALVAAIDALPRFPTPFQRERVIQVTRWLLPRLRED